MNRLVCRDCGTLFYSAAARLLAERGERCEVCGGPLAYVPEPPPTSGEGDADGEVGVGPNGFSDEEDGGDPQ